jgi:hypothetical protein
MIRNSVLILCLVIIIEINYAQNGSTISENINFTVVNGLSLKQIGGNIDFGEVIATDSKQWKTIKANNGARFVVTGFANRKVTINYTRRVTLNNSEWINKYGGNNGTMRFISHVRRTGNKSTYTNPKRVRSGRRYRLENSNGIGKLYLWVGGRIRINANQPQGEYVGTFTITVAY